MVAVKYIGLWGQISSLFSCSWGFHKELCMKETQNRYMQLQWEWNLQRKLKTSVSNTSVLYNFAGNGNLCASFCFDKCQQRTTVNAGALDLCFSFPNRRMPFGVSLVMEHSSKQSSLQKMHEYKKAQCPWILPGNLCVANCALEQSDNSKLTLHRRIPTVGVTVAMAHSNNQPMNLW